MKLRSLFSSQHTVRLLLLIGVDVVFFSVIDPRNAASFVVVVGFLLLLATIYALLQVCMEQIGQRLGLSKDNSKKLVLLLTVFLGVVVGLQSIGQLSLRDLLAITPLIIVLYFYLSYFRQT